MRSRDGALTVWRGSCETRAPRGFRRPGLQRPFDPRTEGGRPCTSLRLPRSLPPPRARSP